MATGGETGCHIQPLLDDIVTPTPVILAESDSEDDTSSSLAVSRQDGSEICRLGQATLMMRNVLAPFTIGGEHVTKHINKNKTFIENQHIMNFCQCNEPEAPTEDTAWSEFDEAQSLNTQDVSPELLDRAVELLDRYGRIALCGSPKSGKSSLAHALLKHYQEKDFAAYLVHRLCCPYEMTKDRKRRSIVLMDGSLGVLRVDKDQFNSCKDLKDRCLLVLTFYPHVLHDLAVLENQSCPLLPHSVVIDMKPHPHHPLSDIDFLPSLQAMIKERDGGYALLALLALCMQGSCHFDQDPSKVAHSLQCLGFTNVTPYDLKLLANNLKGSILSSTNPGFFSRTVYDAAGLALGSFYESLLLRVCDVTFMVQHVQTSGTPIKSVVAIGPRNTAYPELMQRMYEMLVDGQMSELCQHPSLGCPDFMRDFQVFCAHNKNYVQRLVSAVDTKHGLPLLYWSLFCLSTQLTRWCLTIMLEHFTSCKVLSKTLLSAALATVLFAGETDIRSKARSFLANLTLVKSNCIAAGKLTLILPLPTELLPAAEDIRAKLRKLKTDGVCYLDDPSLVIPATLLSLIITEDVVSVELPSQHWNLALRLVADSQRDETDNNGDTLLHLAAHTGHLQAIKIAVKSGASITVTNKEGQSPYQLAQRRRATQKDEISCHNDNIYLYKACKTGDTEAVKVALCHKPSVHGNGGSQDTPLHIVCRARQAEVASLLIQLGTDINSKGEYNETPLYLACKSGDMDTVKLLLQHGAQVNLKGGFWGMPLYVACWIGHTEVVTMLIQHGGLVNAKNDNGWTLLHSACLNGHTEVVTMLIQHGAQVGVKLSDGWTPLHEACHNGYTEIVSMLVQHGAEVDVKDRSGLTPLHWACDSGHTEVVIMMIQHGAQVDVKDGLGWTPLHLACCSGHIEVVTILIQHGAQVGAKDDDGWTPLHWACHKGHAAVVMMLIQHNAQVDVLNIARFTPLHWACQNGHIEVVTMLIQHGADVTAKNIFGKTAAAIAHDREHESLLDILYSSTVRLLNTPQHIETVEYTPVQ